MPTPIPPAPVPPKIPTGQELFDALMMHLEPELTSTKAKTLDEKYKNETPADHAARMKRYDLAFERYETAYNEYMATLDAQVKRYSRDSLAHTERKDQANDQGLLSQFDTFFQAA
jgi:hypothetical protein